MASISLAERHASICQFPAFAFHRQDSGASPRQTDSPTKRLDPSPRKRSVSAPRKNGLLSSPAEVVRRVRDECRVMLYFPSMKKAPTITDWDQICERTYRLVDYIPLQPFLNWKSRGKVVHWIVHVGSVEECTVIEIHLAVSIFDRFLAIRMVKNITFVALSCLVLAVKSSRPKNADQAVERIAFCAGYPVRESSAMTTVISNALDETDVSDIIHIQSFLESICKICHCDDIMRDLVNYLAECMLTDYIGMISFYPSELAATALLVARRSLRLKFVGCPWNNALTRHTSYSEKRLEPCVRWLQSVILRQLPSMSIVKKYSRVVFHEVAKVKLAYR